MAHLIETAGVNTSKSQADRVTSVIYGVDELHTGLRVIANLAGHFVLNEGSSPETVEQANLL